MLIILPDEMLYNWDCFKVEDGKCVPTEIATDKERKAIEEYNEKLRKPRKY